MSGGGMLQHAMLAARVCRPEPQLCRSLGASARSSCTLAASTRRWASCPATADRASTRGDGAKRAEPVSYSARLWCGESGSGRVGRGLGGRPETGLPDPHPRQPARPA